MLSCHNDHNCHLDSTIFRGDAMSESIAAFEHSRHDTVERWRIYGGPHEVVREVYLEQQLLDFTQDVVDGVCGKTGLRKWEITGPGQNQQQCLARKYLAFFLRHHPWALEVYGRGNRKIDGSPKNKGWQQSPKRKKIFGLSFPEIGRIINCDHSTVMSGERRLMALVEFNCLEAGPGLRWIADQLNRSAQYPYFDIEPILPKSRVVQ